MEVRNRREAEGEAAETGCQENYMERRGVGNEERVVEMGDGRNEA